MPKEYGGSEGSSLWMAVIREHPAAKGFGLLNDLQTEASVVGNFPVVEMFLQFGMKLKKRVYMGTVGWSCFDDFWPD